MKWPLFFLLSLSCILVCCKKDSFITSPDAQVTITADTLKFDTLFVTAGSTYRSFKIKNENNQKLLISSLRILGSNSFYRLNVDGLIGPQVNNIEIGANDSVYVFVQVNIDPATGNLPFVIRDSIRIDYNGVSRLVRLEAWGQNAHFMRDKFITFDETWNNDLPYVILGPLVIDTNRTLVINKGCRIFLHADAAVVVDGTLLINGLKDTADRVYFTGDRLDEPYKSFPASWPGIFFRGSSRDNVLNFAVIKNAFQGVATQDLPASPNPKIILNECIIDNAYDAGIIAVNSSIRAQNCLVSNCGKNIFLLKGGNYQFTHCTAASFGNSFIQHRNPVLVVSNFVTVNNVPFSADLNAIFRNCIFWGNDGLVPSEVVVAKNGNTIFNVTLDHDLWRGDAQPANTTVIQSIVNRDPLFDSIDINKNFYSFRLKGGSPAINAGVNAGIMIDLDGNLRPVGLPDLGCYEYR